MIYVDCDASFAPHLGLAGIAYCSTVLGNKRQVVRCGCSTEAEIRAVLMAAADHRGHRHLTLRSDSNAAMMPHHGNGRTRSVFRTLRKRLIGELNASPGWRLLRITRESNQPAHRDARRARKAAERVFA